jgi:uncharacterized cupredoxin-like copper-binding protein
MTFAAQTWTMDTAAGQNTDCWFASDGTRYDFADTSQTVSFTATDTGDGGIYFGKQGNAINLKGGSQVRFSGNKDMDFFKSEANGATVRNGSLWASIDGGKFEEVSIVAMTVTDGDAVGANNLASITFEYPGKPYRWSWTNVNTA